MRNAAAISLCLLLVSASAPAFALDVPPLLQHVNDRAGLLSEGVRADLERRLSEYERQTGHQFALLTVPSLEGDPLEDFSIRAVEAWKLRRKGQDDRLLLLIVPEDRVMRVEVGYALEGDITDLVSGRIIRDVMAPRFREGDFDGGVTQALELLMQAGRGEAVTPPPAPAPTERTANYPRRSRGGSGLFLFLIIVFFLLPMFGGPFGRRRRRRGGFYIGGFGGGGFGGGGLGGGGFGGGGFGGGGFSGGSGSGSGFGGGGASGNW